MVTLIEELPFAFAVDSDYLDTTCSFCFSYGESVHKCAACYSVSYCNKECQKSDWVNHKKECRLLKKWMSENSVAPKATARLTCRILLKSEKELAQVAFNGRTWNCLMDHAAETKSTNDEYSKYFEEQITDIKLFLKPAKDVSQEEVEKALSKVLTNAFCPTMKQMGCQVMGRAIYLGLSVHDHNCFPDTFFVSLGNKGILRSVNPNMEYSSKLTVSYLPRTPFKLSRKSSLKKLYHFECSCPLCTGNEFMMNQMGASCYVDCCEDAAGLPSDNSEKFYKCNKCGTKSTVNRSQVLAMEVRTNKFTFNPSNKINTESIVTEGIKLYEEAKLFLSMYNYQLLDLLGAIRVAASTTGNKEVLRRVSDDLEKAYEYYLPVGEAARTEWQMARAFFDERTNSRMAKIVKEVRLTFGEDHPATKHVQKRAKKRSSRTDKHHSKL